MTPPDPGCGVPALDRPVLPLEVDEADESAPPPPGIDERFPAAVDANVRYPPFDRADCCDVATDSVLCCRSYEIDIISRSYEIDINRYWKTKKLKTRGLF